MTEDRHIKNILAPIKNILVIMFAILLAIGLGGMVILSTGANPFAVYQEIIAGAIFGRGLSETLNRAIPLAGMALALALALRSGLVNLGGDGQMLLGGLAACIVALYLPAAGSIKIILAIVAAIFAGGLYASLAAFLQVRLAIPFLISSLLLSYIARGLTSYLVRYPLRDPSTGLPETYRIAPQARLPNSVFDLPISSSLVIMIVVALIIIIIDKYHIKGFEWRISGQNANFAQYCGINLSRQTYHVAFLSGALAGLVGALIILGQQYRFTDGALLAPNYTWSGLMAAILGLANPVATLFTSIFFSGLQVGGFSMERILGLPATLSWILQALVILCLAARPALFRRSMT